MAVVEVITCDCCGTELESTSILHAILVTYLKEGVGVQSHYGLACGCGDGVLEHLEFGMTHDNHGDGNGDVQH